MDIHLSGACERDLDLFFLEEFVCSLEFSKWFFAQVSPDNYEITTVSEVKRSITQSGGESDLEVWGQLSDGERFLLLIENKITAAAQPKQAARYRKRGENYISNQEKATDLCITVLVAPKAYLGTCRNAAEYDATLSYEHIRDWIQEHCDPSRKEYKQKLLNLAIEKRTLGYNPETDMPVTDFWQSYWNFCNELARELQMPEPGPKLASSRFIRFYPKTMPKNIELIHKLLQGNVDIQIDGMAKIIGELEDRVRPLLNDRMQVEKANKSAAIRITVPTIDTARGFEEQREQVEKGIAAAQELLKWIRDNKQLLAEFITRT